MGREILISVDSHESRCVILENGRLEDYFLDRPDAPHLLHNIYKGIVEDITPALGAVFVNIGFKKKGFLYTSEPAASILKCSAEEKKRTVGEVVRKGDEIIVQITKDPFNNKGPRLTTEISVPGKFIVYMPFGSGCGVSKKVMSDDERKRLRGILEGLPKRGGWIARTAAIDKTKRQIERDAQYLLKLWFKIAKGMNRIKAPALLYKEHDMVLRILRDTFDESVDRVVVDKNKEEFKRVQGYVRSFFPSLLGRVELYKGDVPLFELRGVEAQLAELHRPVVNLPSGAYIVIEQTEALTVIDVNSGRFKSSGRSQEEMALIVNCEAAQEIGRQLRLRDIGGIVVIDFIDMNVPSHKNEVLAVLRSSLANDRAKTDVLGITQLGLVEMTRQRSERTNEQKTMIPCPTCNGRGKIKSMETVVIDLVKEILNISRKTRRRRIGLAVQVHPLLLDYINDHTSELREALKDKKVTIEWKPSNHIQADGFRIESM